MRALGVCAFLFMAGVSHASAQMICTIIYMKNLSSQNIGTPFETSVADSVQVTCPDGSDLSADQIYSSVSTQIMTLSGHVLYSDGKKRVSADGAQYHKNAGLLQAQGERGGSG